MKLKAAFAELSELYEATAEANRRIFARRLYRRRTERRTGFDAEEENEARTKKRRKKLPKNSDYKIVLQIFPEPVWQKRFSARWKMRGLTAALRQNLSRAGAQIWI